MKIKVAALQLNLNLEHEAENIAAVSALVEEAAGQGARIVLPPELFSGGYFCREEDDRFWALARRVIEDHRRRFPELAERAARFDVLAPTVSVEQLTTRRLRPDTEPRLQAVRNPLSLVDAD